MLSQNVKRNRLLAWYIRSIYSSDRRVLVLSDRTAQLALLKDMLAAAGVPTHHMGFYVRTMKGKRLPEKDRLHAASTCRIILATFGMIQLGTDIPDLAGLVYATPQSSVAQSKGRIERLLPKKKYPIVVDIVDLMYEDAMIWFYNRKRFYEREGLVIKIYGGAKHGV